jgi:hypothetical protein
MNSKKELLLHNIAAKYIANEEIDIELDGKQSELSCLKELLDISKKLKEILDSNSSLDNIIKVIEEKKSITKKFESLTGITWRL